MDVRVEHGMTVAGHLGGYIAGGDDATIFPHLWDWLVDVWEVKSVLDIGCGDGQAVNHFNSRGVTVLGVEGIPQDHDLIVRHDFNDGPFDPGREYDLAWSAEFLEHVEERYVPNFMAAFQRCRFVLVTHGEPGQPGYHHVNNQPKDYWVGAFATAGFQFDEQLTAMTRAQAANNPNPYNHYRRSGLAFRRYDV